MNNYFDRRRVVILGGMGFIGSNLAIRLVSLGAEVTLVRYDAAAIWRQSCQR